MLSVEMYQAIQKESQSKRLNLLLDLCADELARTPEEEQCSKEENEVYGDIANLVNSLQIFLEGK